MHLLRIVFCAFLISGGKISSLLISKEQKLAFFPRKAENFEKMSFFSTKKVHNAFVNFTFCAVLISGGKISSLLIPSSKNCLFFPEKCKNSKIFIVSFFST